MLQTSLIKSRQSDTNRQYTIEKMALRHIEILKGEIEGVVMHTNTMADLDYDVYDAAVEWMEQHGEEDMPDSLCAERKHLRHKNIFKNNSIRK